MAVGMLICDNCSQSSGDDCQMNCGPCSCPPEARFTFTVEGPSFEPSASEIAEMEADCGGPNSYILVEAIDSDGYIVDPYDCIQTDSTGKETRIACYQCDRYGLYGTSQAWAPIGPENRNVFIG